MKSLINVATFLLIIIECASFLSFNSDCKDVYWGTKTLYHPLQETYTKPPEGYQPVFINYAGRHGARHLASITADSIMFLVLKTADREKGLTIAGKKLKQMDSLLLMIEKGNVSLISERGQHEQEEIGKRMAQNLSAVFSVSKGTINISTTKKERTKQSAKALLNGLHPDKSFNVINNFNDIDNLAFYDVSPSYKIYKENGSWKKQLEILKNTEEAKATYEALPKQFFTDDFLKKLNSNAFKFYSKSKDANYNSLSFIEGFYDGCSIIPSLSQEITNAGLKPEELDFSSLVPCSFLKELNYIHSAEDYLLKGPGLDNSGIQVNIAAPLLLGFLNSTDEYIASGNVIADMRFGHAETIAPFAALLGIAGASEMVSLNKIQDYNKIWKCENIIPLSSNVQWILYKNKNTNDFMVKFLLNEKEVAINGIKDSGTPYYYKWSDVRAFYFNKLEKLNIHAGDNMHNFLMNVN